MCAALLKVNFLEDEMGMLTVERVESLLLLEERKAELGRSNGVLPRECPSIHGLRECKWRKTITCTGQFVTENSETPINRGGQGPVSPGRVAE